MTSVARCKAFQRSRKRLSSNMRGAGLVKLLLIIPAALILLVLLAVTFFEGRKAYWDYRVREMCEKDGGITVFEQVRLNAEDFRRLNGTNREIPIPERRSAPPMAEYVSDSERSVIRQGSPAVWRVEVTIHAVNGNRTLARYINYSRSGGDFPTFAHPSTFSCDQGFGSVSKRLFIIEGGVK